MNAPKKLLAVLVSGALGAAAALGAGACGEDRGSVEVEGGTTGGSATGVTGATGTTGTTGTSPTGTGVTDTGATTGSTAP